MIEDYGQSLEAIHEQVIARYQALLRAIRAGGRVNHLEFTLLNMQILGIQARSARMADAAAQLEGDAVRTAA
jgi:hypothetical protein